MRNWRPCGRRGGLDQNAIEAKQKELNALRDQMQEKTTVYRLEAKKIAPDFNMGMGVGMGMGMGPGGMGMGPAVVWARKCAAAARQIATRQLTPWS